MENRGQVVGTTSKDLPGQVWQGVGLAVFTGPQISRTQMSQPTPAGLLVVSLVEGADISPGLHLELAQVLSGLFGDPEGSSLIN